MVLTGMTAAANGADNGGEGMMAVNVPTLCDVMMVMKVMEVMVLPRVVLLGLKG